MPEPTIYGLEGAAPTPSPLEQSAALPEAPAAEGARTQGLPYPAAEAFEQAAARLLDDDIQEWTHTAGPLPSASELAAYEAISPGMAEALMQLYAAMRAREEDRNDRRERSRELRRLVALVFTFLLSLLCGYNGLDALSAGDTSLGLAFSGGGASALLWAFLKANDD